MTSSRINPFFERKRFRKEQLFSKKTFLAQVLSLERKCIDVRGMFNDAAAKGFIIGGSNKYEKHAHCVYMATLLHF